MAAIFGRGCDVLLGRSSTFWRVGVIATTGLQLLDEVVAGFVTLQFYNLGLAMYLYSAIACLGILRFTQFCACVCPDCLPLEFGDIVLVRRLSDNDTEEEDSSNGGHLVEAVVLGYASSATLDGFKQIGFSGDVLIQLRSGESEECFHVGARKRLPLASSSELDACGLGRLCCKKNKRGSCTSFFWAAFASLSGLATPMEALRCALAPNVGTSGRPHTGSGVSVSLCELRLLQATHLSAPLFFLQLTSLTIEGWFRTVEQDPSLFKYSPLISLFAYTAALTSYLRSNATHHARRIVCPWLGAASAGFGLAIFFSADLCLRVLAIAVLTCALGPWLNLSLIGLFMALFFMHLQSIYQPIQPNFSIFWLIRLVFPRMLLSPIRFWRLVGLPRVVWAPIFLSSPTSTREANREMCISTALCSCAVVFGSSPWMPHANPDADFRHRIVYFATFFVAAKISSWGWCVLPALTGKYPILLASRQGASIRGGGRGCLSYTSFLFRSLMAALTCGGACGSVRQKRVDFSDDAAVAYICGLCKGQVRAFKETTVPTTPKVHVDDM